MNFDFIQVSIAAQISLGIAIIALMLTILTFHTIKKSSKK